MTRKYQEYKAPIVIAPVFFSTLEIKVEVEAHDDMLVLHKECSSAEMIP